MAGHKCNYPGIIEKVNNTDTNVAVILAKMEARDLQRAEEKKMYKEQINKIGIAVAKNTEFRTKATGVWGFIVFLSSAFGVFLWNIASKLFSGGKP